MGRNNPPEQTAVHKHVYRQKKRGGRVWGIERIDHDKIEWTLAEFAKANPGPVRKQPI